MDVGERHVQRTPHRIEHCARCGGTHDNIRFRPLTRALGIPEAGITLTHWLSCPTNGEPVLARIVDTIKPPT